ncbi:competence protein ComK [Gracilibacillus boraciitolerans]|uniref:competence protein ComK n=1 Tax=Gracilibacillus boraciitolerans TaxID=307521 RepID=UPI00068DF9A7|nr:competence protein ComK [Gracilibacillus boraciitolerans]
MPASVHCIWLFFHAIQSIHSTSSGTQVILANNKTLLIDQSIHTIKKQYNRKGMCKVVFDQMK